MLICLAIAMFMAFLIQTPFLHHIALFLLNLLVTLQVMLKTGRLYLIVTPVSLLVDIVTILCCAWIWTRQNSVERRLGGLGALVIILMPLSYYLFMRKGVFVISLMIAAGTGMGMIIDFALEYFDSRYRRKIVSEKNDAEYNIVRHLNHNLKPGLLMAASPIQSVMAYLEARGMLHDTLAMRLDGGRETVEEALHKSLASLEHISAILEGARQLVTREISPGDFRDVSLRELFDRDILPHFSGRLAIELVCAPSIVLTLHRQSFVEAMLNLIRNAEIHGFQGDCTGARLVFHARERRRSVVMDYTNNGLPFPDNLDEKDFLTFGKKSADSPGEGLGGAWIGKVLEAHNARFRIIRDEHPLHFRFVFPRGRI